VTEKPCLRGKKSLLRRDPYSLAKKEDTRVRKKKSANKKGGRNRKTCLAPNKQGVASREKRMVFHVLRKRGTVLKKRKRGNCAFGEKEGESR